MLIKKFHLVIRAKKDDQKYVIESSYMVKRVRYIAIRRIVNFLEYIFSTRDNSAMNLKMLPAWCHVRIFRQS